MAMSAGHSLDPAAFHIQRTLTTKRAGPGPYLQSPAARRWNGEWIQGVLIR